MSEGLRLSESRRANLATRAQALRALRAHFDAAGFLEVETPAMVPSPGLDLHLDAFEVQAPEAARYLHTSPEYQMKRLLSAGFSRIYQVCKAFRQGERGHLHNPEFTMVEWYRVGSDMEGAMSDTEELVAAVTTALHGSARLPGHPPTTGVTGGVGSGIDVTPPWPRLRVSEAFERYAGVSLGSVLPDEDRFYRLLIERIEPQLGRQRPTFLTHYPASMASLARISEDDPRYADRFEAYLDGVELANGFAELTDATEQRARLLADQQSRKAAGKPVYPIDERFLAALAEGLPPCAGTALGFDRLVMLLTGAHSIDQVLSFTVDELT